MQQTKVIGSQISTEFFIWLKENETFVAEASELPKYFNPESQIWNDSYDAGFVLVSEVTGKKLIFTLTGQDISNDEDREVMGWLFTAQPSFNKGVLTEPVRALIIND